VSLLPFACERFAARAAVEQASISELVPDALVRPAAALKESFDRVKQR
jgi:hypothetical protein